MLDRINPNLHMNKQVFFDEAEYTAVDIDTPFLTPKTEDPAGGVALDGARGPARDTPKTPDQETFQRG